MYLIMKLERKAARDNSTSDRSAPFERFIARAFRTAARALRKAALKRNALQTLREGCRAGLLALCLAVSGGLHGFANATAEVVWREGFEGPSVEDDWVAEGGVWEIGQPTSGPESAFAGLRVAATVLAGAPPEGLDSVFYRYPSFEVPPADREPQLRLQHWYEFGADDYGQVVVQVVGSAQWEPLSTYTAHSGGVWTRPALDLRPYAGQRLRVGFLFHSQVSTNGFGRPEVETPGPGWYVDEVEVVTGPVAFLSGESFDDPAAADRWHVTHGFWEIGAPTSGPGQAWSGTRLAGTVLAGDCPEHVKYNSGWGAAPDVGESRLVGPAFVVPEAGLEPRLRFRHWYHFGAEDRGQAEVQVEGAAGWETLSSYTAHSGGVWSRPALDLRKYAGQRLRIGFLYQGQVSTNGFGRWEVETPGPGWYVDEVEVVTGPPTSLGTEGFEDAAAEDRWQVTRGFWEIGEPRGERVDAASGTRAAGTVLAGDCPEWVKHNSGWGAQPDVLESRLVSPTFAVPEAVLEPRLRFRHWHDFGADDHGQAQVQREGAETWESLSTYTTHSSGVWSRPALDLRKYAGQRLRVGFLYHGQVSTNGFGRWEAPTPGPGWYVDDIEVVTGPLAFLEREGFEDPGAADRWEVTGGIWQIGEPTSGPNRAASGTRVAGTVLAGDYLERVKYNSGWRGTPDVVESRLVSPVLQVPEATAAPHLRFRHWYDFGADDVGQAEVWVEGGEAWQPLRAYTTHGGGVWSRPALDLGRYAGQRVRLGFLFRSQVSTNGFGRWEAATPGPGWFLDDVEVVTGPRAFRNPDDFDDAGADDRWLVTDGVWEFGVPTSGPEAASSGTRVAGTVLAGDYVERIKYNSGWHGTPDVQRSRLVSAVFQVPAAGGEPRLRFRHWYAFGADDLGQAEVWVEDVQQWEALGTYTGHSGGVWSRPALDLSPYAGRRVRLGFLLQAQVSTNGFGRWEVPTPAPGWYLDEVSVVVNDLRLECDWFLDVAENDCVQCRVTSRLAQPVFGLGDGAPEGAAIDPVLGIFSWCPTERQGPSTNVITLTVTDPHNPTLQPLDAEILTVVVREVNQSPVIAALPPLPIRAGGPVNFRLSAFAFDPDEPAQTLTYTLEPGSPDHATLDPATGVLSWIPTAVQAAQTNTLVFRVTDAAGLSATQTMLAGPFVTGPLIRQAGFDGPDLVLWLDGVAPGQALVVESTTALKTPSTATVWSEVRSLTWQSNPVRIEGVRDAGPHPARFFRFRLSP